MAVKYEKEITKLIREVYEDGDLDVVIPFEDFKKEVLEEVGTDMEGLSNQLQLGVDNGYSIEQQLNICRSIMNRFDSLD